MRNAGSFAEMSNGFTGISSTPEKDCVGTSRTTESQLVESQTLATSSDNASTSSLSKSQSSNVELGDIKESLVVGHSANKDSNLVVLLAPHVSSNAGYRHGRAVCAAHGKALKNSLVEWGLGAASQKAVELHQQKKVRILRDWLSSVAILGVLMLKINTHGDEEGLQIGRAHV